MTNIRKILWVSVLFIASFLLTVPGLAQDLQDENADEPAARVARIKFIEGDAQLKRIDGEEWEKAALNLPMVEGDELQTFEGARVEIQFDNETYLRMDENSIVKIVSLGDEGTALSISRGTALFSVLTFDTDAGYLEIDAPQTTVAITGEGKYRIDAGDEFDRTVSVSVWDGGTARLYTLDSGFSLKNDQTATMNLDGTYAGKWEVARSLQSFNDFDQWSADRDDLISKSLADAHYGKYYDSNIYGADELNDNGSWQYDNSYGYLWRPYDRAISGYNDWSPYRYGHWRWLPYYGWTWVNDEPWGWSTYHYGRWIFLNGHWFWTPYSYSSYYGGGYSWWRPAIVYMGYIGGRICWYPLAYNYRYYNYNWRYRNYWPNHRRGRRDRTNTNTQPTSQTPNAANIARGDKLRTPPLQRIPRSAVISAGRDVFGKNRGGYETAPPDVSREILKKNPAQVETPPILPTRTEINGKRSPDIIVLDRKPLEGDRTVKIGVGDRKAGEPMDKTLKNQKMYPTRPPLTTIPRVQPDGKSDVNTRKTGVFPRPVTPKKAKPTSTPPIYRPTPATKSEERKPSPPVYRPQPTSKPTERKTSPPVYTPPTRRPDPPKREEPRNTYPAPTRTQPPARPNPPPKSPPPKSSPKSETKPAPKPPVPSKKSDS